MEKFLSTQWDESYDRNENYIFYPKEAVVKFINKYVRKRIAPNKFINILHNDTELRALDLGCGIGRQTILFEEFNITGYGVDISEKAIEQAKNLAKFLGYDMTDRFSVITKVSLPFEDNYFDVAISDSVLDSMKFEYAKDYIFELDRTVKSLVYISLISNDILGGKIAKDITVTTPHEFGTIQSYYDRNRIEMLIADTNWKILSLYKTMESNIDGKFLEGRFHLILSKKQ